MESGSTSLGRPLVALPHSLQELLAAFYELTDRDVLPGLTCQGWAARVVLTRAQSPRFHPALIQDSLKHGGRHLEIRQYAGEIPWSIFKREADDSDENRTSLILTALRGRPTMRTGQNTGLGLAI